MKHGFTHYAQPVTPSNTESMIIFNTIFTNQLPANTQRYCLVLGSRMGMNATSGSAPADHATFSANIMPRGGTFQNFWVNGTGLAVGETLIATLYVNGNPSALTVTLTDVTVDGSGNAQNNDSTHTVTVSAGDLLEWYFDATAVNTAWEGTIGVELLLP